MERPSNDREPYHYTWPLIDKNGKIDEDQLSPQNLDYLRDLDEDGKRIYVLMETVRRATNRDLFLFDDVPGASYAVARFAQYLKTGDLSYPPLETLP